MTIKFKTKKEIDKYFSGEKIECLICGKHLRAVSGKHLSDHDMTPFQYKQMFGLPMGRGLVSDKTRDLQRAALVRRMESGKEPCLEMTPEKMEIAQRARKTPLPHYHIANMKKFGIMGLTKIKSRSVKRAASIDWEYFLREVRNNEAALWTMRGKDGMPSYYDLKKKLSTDNDFKERYDATLKKFRKGQVLANEVLSLTKSGKSQREIAKMLPISKTHIARIQKSARQDK